MKCRYNIVDYAHGQVSDKEKGRIEEHLKTCARCRRRLSEVRTLVDDLKTIGVPEQDSEYWEGYQRNLASRLEEARARAGGATTGSFLNANWVPARPAWVFAAALALLVAGVVIGRASLPDVQRVAERPVPQETASTLVARNADTAAEIDEVLDWIEGSTVSLEYLSALELEALTEEEVAELAEMLGIGLYGAEEVSENGLTQSYFFDYSIHGELEELSPQELEGIDGWFELI